MGARITFVLLLGLVLLAGCSDDDGPAPTPAPTQTAPPSATATAVPSSTHTSAPTATATIPATATSTETAAPTATATQGPLANAHRITDAGELPGGPLAHGRVGDYMLENSVARFVIQDVGKRDLYSVGQFGGNIIDAELRARPNLDNFLEVQPAVNVETVINAQTVEIVNDGSDGQPAVIRTCGPDDLLDFVNPSTIIEGAGLPFPAGVDDQDYDVEGCTEYSLDPTHPYVKMTTTIFNNGNVQRGFFVGDYINGSGELDQWTSTEAGLGEILTGAYDVLSYIGIGEATGVDYSLVPVPIAGSPVLRSGFFTASGVSYLMQSNSILNVIFGSPPTFFVPAGGSNSYVRYFGVGDGSASNAVNIRNEVLGGTVGTLRGCVTVGGEPASSARVSVGLSGGGRIGVLSTIFTTGPDGCYSGTLPPNTYGAAAAQSGVPFESSAPTPPLHPVTIVAGETTVQDFALPQTGHLTVHVRDGAGNPLPARINVVGFDPSPEPILPTAPIPGLGQTNTGMFNDITKDAVPFGFVALAYAQPDGDVTIDVEPGSYQLYVSRGVEYSLSSQPVTITAGQTLEVEAKIVRVVDTPGFVSSDFHVHGINSADARVSHKNRVFQFAGEGVDNIIMTDHHSHTDLIPVIERLGFALFVHSTIGEEITTWDYGHLNAYPFTIDPARPSGGSTDWAMAAPPGRDFPAYGAYGATPEQIYNLAVGSPQATADTTIQINHIDSFYDPLQIDTGVVPPRSFLSAANKLKFRLDPTTDNLYFHYPALELWNGSARSHQHLFLDTRIGVWMNQLNQGLITTAIADTDTHEFLNLNTAGARTWTASPTDDPPAIDDADISRAVKNGKAVGGQGAYVQTRLRAADESGGIADLTLDGTNIVRSTAGVDLDIDVQAPLWAPYDRIEIYANAQTVVAKRNGDVPTLYGAEPTLTLNAGTDFTVETVEVDSNVPGAQRLHSQLTVPFHGITSDTWFVVVARGTDGVSRPMFPVFPQDIARASNTNLAELIDGNLNESGVLSLGFTNALYADVDGENGFQIGTAPQ